MKAMNTIITEKNYRELLGKELEWSAPAAEGNATYGGKTIIKAIDWTKERGGVACKTIEGDDLSFAIVADYGRRTLWGEGDWDERERALCYSDADRFVFVNVKI